MQAIDAFETGTSRFYLIIMQVNKNVETYFIVRNSPKSNNTTIRYATNAYAFAVNRLMSNIYELYF